MWRVGRRYRVRSAHRGLFDGRLYGKTKSLLVFDVEDERVTLRRDECEVVMELVG